MQLKIPFSDIPEHGIECEIRDSSWFPGDLLEQAGLEAVHIRLIKKNENRIELKGNLLTRVSLECDRCLKRYAYPVDSSMQLVVEVEENGEHWRLQDIETSGTELETVSVDKPIVDLGEILRQQLFLSLPEKRLCVEKCLGLCPQCGADLNERNCSCSRPVESSPFSVLEKLKKK